MEKLNVFVYGSLKKGFSNHYVMNLAKGEYIDGGVSSESKFTMCGVGNSFPGLLSGTGKFSGEVYSVPKESISYHLDMLEGYPDFYNRCSIKVTLNTSNDEVDALVYYLSDDYIKNYGEKLLLNSPRISYTNNVYTWNQL